MYSIPVSRTLKELSIKFFGEELETGIFLEKIREKYNQEAVNLVHFIVHSGRLPTISEWELLKAIEDSWEEKYSSFFSPFSANECPDVVVIKGNFYDGTAMRHNKQVSGIPMVADRVHSELALNFSYLEIYFDEKFMISEFSNHTKSAPVTTSKRVVLSNKLLRIFLAGSYAVYREVKFIYPGLAKFLKRLKRWDFNSIVPNRHHDTRSESISILVDVNLVSCTSIFDRKMMDQLQIFMDCKFVKFIPLVHDLLPIITPRFFPVEGAGLNLQYYRLVFGSFQVFAVSEKVASDLRKYFSLLEQDSSPDVQVFNLSKLVATAAQDYLPDSKGSNAVYFDSYILCISTLEPRKNHFVLIAALVPLFEKYADFRLVLLGGFGWENQDLMSYLSKTKYSDRIVILRNISESEKYLWIQNSIATVYPSLYEGFGLPILESLVVGKPTVYHFSAPMNFFSTYLNSYPVDMTSVMELENTCEKLISSFDSQLLKKTRFELDKVSQDDSYFSFIENLSQ